MYDICAITKIAETKPELDYEKITQDEIDDYFDDFDEKYIEITKKNINTNNLNKVKN